MVSGPVGSCATSANTGATRTTALSGTILAAEEAGVDDEPYELYVGMDWATAAHQVCLLNADGRQREELTVPHSGAGLAALRAQLQARVSEPSRIAVAIEVPHGPVVDALLDHGCHVYAINPKQLDRFRDRHTVAGACWLPVFWIQIQMRNLAEAAVAAGQPLPARYWKLLKVWVALGIPAFFALVVVFYLMVAKPS